MNKTLTLITNVCRLLLALTFIFSGYVKAIDPLGTQYKMIEMLSAAGMTGVVPDWITLMTAVAVAAVEFSLGIFLLMAIQRRNTSKWVLGIMVVMTAITLWLWIANPVKDCGCFGDAIKLSNGETFAKNIVLLAAAIMVARHPLRMFRFVSETNQWIVINYTVVFILISSGICLYNLPLFDFRPYKIGTDIQKSMEIPEGAQPPKFETTFIMQKGGVQQEFTLDNYPDSTWEFVDSKTVQTKEGYVPPIHDFSIEDKTTGQDITQQVLTRKGFTFLLISPHLEQADDTNFGAIDQIYEYAKEANIPLLCLTASQEDAIKRWQDLTGAEYPFYTTDETTLKTIIRSNPGLLLLKDGVIINKWSHNFLPKAEELNEQLHTLETGKTVEDGVGRKITKILLWFILPLTFITLADRTWAWSKWLRKRNKINQLIKKRRQMRKKIVAGNWKMNLNLQEGVALAKEVNDALVAEKPNCDVVICTPFIHLATVAGSIDKSVLNLGAENCADKEKGAFTGEVSAEMVKSTGADYVILGHSERREYYKETPEVLKEKVLLALKNNLKVIFCIGESLAEREANKQNEVCKAELEGSVFNLSAEEFKNIVIAYEPIWAIGTGKTATSDQAEEIHAFIRSTIEEKYGKEVAENTSILYGGSCNAKNAPELFAKPNIDGGLIGGASLKCADFKGIIDAWTK
ncbi:MAG: triose-phosphate isomerase [Prevotella sp.]|nr:triose-phosphate isomerase [Prevotella sp.]